MWIHRRIWNFYINILYIWWNCWKAVPRSCGSCMYICNFLLQKKEEKIHVLGWRLYFSLEPCLRWLASSFPDVDLESDHFMLMFMRSGYMLRGPRYTRNNSHCLLSGKLLTLSAKLSEKIPSYSHWTSSLSEQLHRITSSEHWWMGFDLNWLPFTLPSSIYWLCNSVPAVRHIETIVELWDRIRPDIPRAVNILRSLHLLQRNLGPSSTEQLPSLLHDVVIQCRTLVRLCLEASELELRPKRGVFTAHWIEILW